MFRELLALLRKKNLFAEALDESVDMLLVDQEMFLEVVASLRRRDNTKFNIDIFATDKKINKYERDVRRKVLTHLCISGTSDIPVGLALVSVVIDIERIGDYTKNIADLASMHPKKLVVGNFEEQLSNIEDKIKKFFEKTIQAFKESDSDVARQVLDEYPDLSHDCDTITLALVKDGKKYKVRDAVPLGLYLRYLKRVAAHLYNICTSIVNPFHRIGFKEKKQKE